MPKLRTQTVTLLDGNVRLVKRKRSRAGQAAFKIDGRSVRVSTKCRQLDDAKKQPRELYVEYQLRQKNGLPVISKRFADVARIVIADMEQQLAAGVGKASWRDYKMRAGIGRYLSFWNTRRPHSSLDGKTPDRAHFNQPKPKAVAA